MKRYLYLVLFGLALSAGCKKKGSVEILCGGLIDAQCSPAMYCHLNSGCGGFDREGVCKPRPARCPEERSPVCGCDGKMHESPCYAALRGVSVAHEGECTGAEKENAATELGEDELGDDAGEAGAGDEEAQKLNEGAE